MSDIPAWNCDFSPSAEPGGVALDSLTVGAPFVWKCHGDVAVAWDAEMPALTFAKTEDQYTLHILKILRQDPNDVQYLVTAYKAGEHAPEYIRVLQGQGTAGEKGFAATAPKWAVKSVLDPKQPPQPVPPFGPWSLSLPLWFYLLIAAVLLAITFAVLRVVRRHLQRRRMLEDLKRFKTPLPPLHQFYRDARQLRRRLHNVKDPTELKTIGDDLDRDFRLYVLRQFQIPALDWSNRAILEDLRRRHRKTYNAAAVPLKRTLSELLKLKTQAKPGVNDLEQMHRMSLDAAERLQSEAKT